MSAVLVAVTWSVLVAGPMAQVSPFEAERLADGTVEYSYDLTAAKAGLTPDVVARYGQERVQTFLKSLPHHVSLRVTAGASLSLAGGRAMEAGPLAPSFAAVEDGPWVSSNPLENRGARILPAFAPELPHLLLSADAVAWQVRQLELSALAAVELEGEADRRRLWSAVLTRALERHQKSQGDAREGALALAGRVSAALSCLTAEKVPPAVRADAEASLVFESERQKLLHDSDARQVPAPWSWRSDLRCAWLSAWVMAQPFERSRAGTAAVLTMIDVLEHEPKLAQLWDRVRKHRDLFLGVPATDVFSEWRAKVGKQAAASMDDLNAFIESLPLENRTPPALLAAPETPFSKFWASLSGPERGQGFAELVSAVQDGRLALSAASWPVARESALAAWCQVDGQSTVRFDSVWSHRFEDAFKALQGGPLESADEGGENIADMGDRDELEVRLLVPPLLDVEPAPAVYAQSAVSLQKLLEALTAVKLQQLAGLNADGPRTATLAAELKLWISRLKGLATLSTPGANRSSREAQDALRFVRTWRADPGFAIDVYAAASAPRAMSTERQHAAWVGVARRELVVRYAKSPTVVALNGQLVPGLNISPGEQRYLVPILVSVGATADGNRGPLDLDALKQLVQHAGGDLAQVQGAFAEALRP